VPRALFAAEYPPTNSVVDKPHANPTSRNIALYIGEGRADWVDVYPFAPIDTPSGLVDRGALVSGVLADADMQSDWIRRVAGRLVACAEAGTVRPVVYVSGKMCSAIWATRSYERMQLVSTLSQSLGVHVYRTVTTAECTTSECTTAECTTEFLVMLDQPHPSWSLVSHGDPTAVASFKRAMCVLKGLLRDDGDRATLDEPRLLAMIDETERLRLERRSAFLARVGIRDGQLPSSLSHFRDAPYENDDFMEQLDELLAYGLTKPQLLRVMSRSLFNRPLERSTREALKWWREKLGARAFVTFMCDGVASALASSSAAAFNALLDAWYGRLGKQFATFMCGSVASGLASPSAAAFNALLLEWYARLGEKFVTFMCDGVASGLASPNFAAFNALLLEWYARLGETFATFMCNGVASALASPNFAAFNALLLEWYVRLGEKFVTFMCDGVASGLASPNAAAFNALLDAWYAKLDKDAFATFMCNGVASGLASPNTEAFNAKLNDLREVVGADFVALMRNGVACRILDASFFSGLVACYERHSAAEERAMLLKFVALGVAAIDRLGEAEFWRTVDDICTTLPRPTLVVALARLRDHGD
jgi:hypothetical protein